MNKINFAIALALTFITAVACDKDRVAYDMTEAGREIGRASCRERV